MATKKKELTWSEWRDNLGGYVQISDDDIDDIDALRKDYKNNREKYSSNSYTREDILRRMRDLRSDWQSDIDRGADMSRVIGSAGGIEQTYGDYYRRRMDQLQRYLQTAGKRAMQGGTDDVQGVYSAIRGANDFLDDMGIQLSNMPTAPQSTQTTLSTQQEDDEQKGWSIDQVRNWFAERANSSNGRTRMGDRIAAHNAQAYEQGFQPQYDVNDAASAYFGYMQLPQEARDPQTEAYYRAIHEGSSASLERGVEETRQQEEQRGKDWFAEQEAKYSTITSRPDFAQNIEGWEMQTGYAGGLVDNTPEAEAYYNYMYLPEEERDPEIERRACRSSHCRRCKTHDGRAETDLSVSAQHRGRRRGEGLLQLYLLRDQCTADAGCHGGSSRAD